MKQVLLIFIITFLSSAQNSFDSDPQNLREHVSALVTTSEARSYKHPEVLDMIASYIRNEFSSYGYREITEQKIIAKDKEYKNVIASVGPESTEIVVIGAHYDVFGDLPGADDNASGIAGLLECARIIYQNREKLKNKVEFVAYTLEEPPFFNTRFMGSYAHASYLSDNEIKTKLMICLEMIGYYSEERKSQNYPIGILKPFYGSKGDYITSVADIHSGRYARKLNKIFNQRTEIKGKRVVLPKFIPGIAFSDHRNYWGYKMKALMITDTANYRNKNYHTKADTIEKLNFSKMAEVVKGLVFFVLEI